jgi:hypothetical protein
MRLQTTLNADLQVLLFYFTVTRNYSHSLSLILRSDHTRYEVSGSRVQLHTYLNMWGEILPLHYYSNWDISHSKPAHIRAHISCERHLHHFVCVLSWLQGPRTYMVHDENGDLLADSHILNR